MTGSNFIDFDKALNKGIKLIKTNENPSFGLLVVVGINLGLRIDDLLKLSFDDLRTDKIEITEGKTKKRRALVINGNIQSALSYFDNDLIGSAFKSQKGTTYSVQHVNRLIKKYFKGENISSHSLRKSFGRRVWTNDNESEKSLIYLSELFNHSSSKITRTYLGIRQSELDNIYMSL
jgi:integrase